MQLASQRPHPPPVPPRPSRQVVAEALKRSPRPPCPTRQAPPPPNTKPWRGSDQQQHQNKQQVQQQKQQQQPAGPTGGRTIVYESKECAKEGSKEENDDRSQQQDRKQARDNNATDKSAEEENRSEKNEGKKSAAPHHERREVCPEKKLHHPTGNVPANIVRKHNNNPLTEDRRPQRRPDIRKNSCGKDQAAVLPDPRGRCKDSPGTKENQERTNSAERVIEVTATTKPPTVAARANVNVSSFEDERRESLPSPDSLAGGGRVTVSHVDKCGCDSERVANGSCLGEQIQQQQQEATLASAKAAAGNVDAASIKGAASVVPSVDRVAATVLVVDEAERKIAPGDQEDGNSNDSDSNIHQQDWLEEGIRYSSTQITLHGDDGGGGDRDRVNGYYDHHEEERITDLDFIR